MGDVAAIYLVAPCEMKCTSGWSVLNEEEILLNNVRVRNTFTVGVTEIAAKK